MTMPVLDIMTKNACAVHHDEDDWDDADNDGHDVDDDGDDKSVKKVAETIFWEVLKA